MDILSEIHNQMQTFSKGQKRIANYILTEFDKAAFMTAGALGKATEVSESTVVRFASGLGYDGYPEMQKALQEMVLTRLTSVQRMEVTTHRIGAQDLLSATFEADISMLQETLDQLDRNAFFRAVDLLLSARRIYIVGVRSSSTLAHFLAFYLKYMFDDVRLVTASSESEACGDIIRSSPQDAVIGISFPRYSTATCKTMEYCHSAGVPVIALTDSSSAPIAQVADCLLCARSGMVSLVDSLVAPMSLINALVVAMAEKRKQEAADTFDRLEKIWDNYHVYEKDDV